MRAIPASLIAAAAAAASGGTMGFVFLSVLQAWDGHDWALLVRTLPAALLGVPFFSVYFGFFPALIVIVLIGLPVSGWLESHYRTGPSDYAQAGLMVGMVLGALTFAVPPLAVACITGGTIGAIVLGLIMADPPWQTDKWPMPKSWRAWLES